MSLAASDSNFMLNLRKTDSDAGASPEELFARKYKQLLGWSLQLTGGDRSAAEDLLHDVFVLFSLRQPELSNVANLEGYLYTMLRNLHLSQLRRATRTPLQQLSIIEFDLAETGLRAFAADERVRVQDDLRRVCLHACARKERAKSACALILRFFHGYYPSEVARVLKTSRQAVDVRLLAARREARLVLESPQTLGFVGGGKSVPVAPSKFTRPADDLLQELRQTIFQTRRGECAGAQRLKELYHPSNPEQPGQELLAHVVSCRRCLDEVNAALGIPPLSERHWTDSINRETRGGGGGDRGGGDGDGGGGVGGELPASKLKRMRRRAGEVFEHKPRELCVSVNGYVRGSQRVTSERSELSLAVESAEPISFVEVFSEQGVRLLMLAVEAPPAGAGEQALDVALSDGRALALSLKFRSPWPDLHLLYEDPTFSSADELSLEEEEEARRKSPTSNEGEARREPPASKAVLPGGVSTEVRDGWWRLLEDSFKSLPRKLFGGRLRLSPGVLTALLSIVLVAVLLTLRLPTSVSVSAAELLRRSAVAEQDLSARADIVRGRTIELEERRVSDGELLARRRIQIWQSAERGVTARRLYDERGRLLAGEWRGADGSRTFYRAPDATQPTAAQPGASTAAEPPSHATAGQADASWSIDNVWQYEPSARDFAALTGGGDASELKENADTYLLTYEGGASAARGLVSATLVLQRGDLHATEQTLVVERAGARHRFRFKETGYVQRPKGAVAPSVFEPDREFLAQGVIRVVSPAADGQATATTTDANVAAQTDAPAVAAAAAATAALEVEVLRLLSQAGADLGEQISVARASGGGLHVQAVVETERRKSEILGALGPVLNNPALRVEVVTAAEAVRRRAQGPQTSSPVVVQQVEPTENRVPADEELRRYFSRGRSGGEDQTEADINRFASRASARSRQALQHAWALKRLAGRFSAQELRTLDEESRGKWLSMLREHAGAVRRETAALRQELQPIFSPQGGASAEGGGGGGASDADIIREADALLAMCSEVDSHVRSAFTVSNKPAAPASIKSQAFWRALRGAEAAAARLQSRARKQTPAPEARPRANPSGGAEPSPPTADPAVNFKGELR